MHQRHDFRVALHDDALCDQRHGVQLILYLLRVDVLSVGTEQHVLRAAVDIDIAVFIHGAEVAGVIPPVLVEGLACCLLVLVVAQHDVQALGQDFAWDGGWVWRVNLHLHVLHGTSAGARGKGVPVAVADDGSTLRSSVAHGVWEVDAFEERLHLLIEGGTTDNNLVHIATESLEHLLTNHFTHFLRNDRHLQQQSHTIVLNLGEHLLAHYFLNDQRHGDDHAGFHLGQGLGDDGGRRRARQVVHMAAVEELENKLEGHAIHVGHGQDGDDMVALGNGAAQHLTGKVIVRPQCTVGNHHAFRKARRSAGIVDECQFVRALLHIIIYVFLAEVLGELLSVERVQVLAGIGQFLRAREQQGVVRASDDALQSRHLVSINGTSHVVAGEEKLGVGMVHDVVNLLRHELMEDRHGNSSVGERGKEGHGPLAAVAAAKGYLVALHHTGVLEQYVDFLNLACHVVVLQGLTLVVGQRIQIPEVDDAFLNQLVKAGYVFHRKNRMIRQIRG